jgi:antibiotic biosynthesis monooxygenase (ABM) superfamily enzyme
LHTLSIYAKQSQRIEREDLWDRLENEIMPLVEKFPYHRGAGYRVKIGQLRGEFDYDMVIEVKFASMDSLEQAAGSRLLDKITERGRNIFDKDSIAVIATHQR